MFIVRTQRRPSGWSGGVAGGGLYSFGSDAASVGTTLAPTISFLFALRLISSVLGRFPSNVRSSPLIPQSARAHQFGEPGPCPAPKLMNVYLRPSISSQEESANHTIWCFLLISFSKATSVPVVRLRGERTAVVGLGVVFLLSWGSFFCCGIAMSRPRYEIFP